MAQERASDASVASTSSNLNNWWDNHIHANSLSAAAASTTSGAAWNHHLHSPWHHQQAPQLQQHQQVQHQLNPNSNSCTVLTTSFTNQASSNSGLSAESPGSMHNGGELPTVDNQLWSQLLLGTGNNGHEDGENFLEALSSKMFEPACDYLKKLDGSWEFTPNSANTFNGMHQKAAAAADHGQPAAEFSDLVGSWSIALPQHHFDRGASQMAPPVDVMGNNLPSHTVKHESPQAPPGHLSLMEYSLKPEMTREIGAAAATSMNMLRPIGSGGDCIGYHQQLGLTNSVLGGSGSDSTGMALDLPWSINTTRNFTDLISFGGCLSRNLVPAAPKPLCGKSLETGELESMKQQGRDSSSSSTKGSVKVGVSTSEGKKKRSDDNTQSLLPKKSRHESSNSPSSKLQVPKVKLGEKITALQQLVSPFGKTDTASVLLETIRYIKILHEQVQLLSDPYMKSALNKVSHYQEHSSWGGPELRKVDSDQETSKLDLSSRGLCLVPVSCTPQVCRDNSGPDYWTPTYRGCLYR